VLEGRKRNAFPYGVTSEVISYNKDLFDQCDVPYPEVGWTWADSALDICGDLWVHGYAISSQTQHPEAAWQLIAFLSRQMVPRQIPPRRSHAESKEYEQLVGSETADTARHVVQHGLPWPTRRFSDITLPAILVLGDAAAKIRSGEMTSQEAMDWAQQEAPRRIVYAPAPSPAPSTGQGLPSP
jgi:ABC-type glycerol-3-phosphate transport system substrate-binding protein